MLSVCLAAKSHQHPAPQPCCSWEQLGRAHITWDLHVMHLWAFPTVNFYWMSRFTLAAEEADSILAWLSRRVTRKWTEVIFSLYLVLGKLYPRYLAQFVALQNQKEGSALASQDVLKHMVRGWATSTCSAWRREGSSRTSWLLKEGQEGASLFPEVHGGRIRDDAYRELE